MNFPYDRARVLFGGFRMGWQPSARSTDTSLPGKQFQGGDQPLPLFTRQFRYEVSMEDVAAFRAWMTANANTLFGFYDPDAVLRQVRVSGGAQHTLAGMEKVRDTEGKAVWQGRMTVEGLYEPPVNALPRGAWPADITQQLYGDYQFEWQRPSVRLGFEDGYVRQQQINAKARIRRDVKFNILTEDVKRLLAWAQAVGSDAFQYRDADGNTRAARIENGQGGLSFEGLSGRRRGGATLMTGEATLVGLQDVLDDFVMTIGGETMTIGGEAMTIGLR